VVLYLQCCDAQTTINVDLTPFAACLLTLAALFVVVWARIERPGKDLTDD
jgi:hypothetical protein